MAEGNNIIRLTTQPFITHCANSVRPTDQDAYIVRSGEVLIFIAKWQKREDRQGIAMFVGEVKAGEVFPAFSYRDEERVEWRFVVKAKSSTAELEIMPHCVTSILRANFARQVGLVEYDREGFENSLVEFYKAEELKADVLHERALIIEGGLSQKISNLIVRPFESSGGVQIDENDTAMKAVRYAAKFLQAEEINFEKVRQKCRGSFDIPTIANASDLLCREVVLEQKWFEGDCGVLIGRMDKTYVVLVPGKFGYAAYDIETNQKQKLTKGLAEKLEPKAYSIERSLPGKALTMKDLFRFGIKDLGTTDVVTILVLGLVTALISSLLLPKLNQTIYDEYIPLGNQSELAQICLVIGTFMIGNLFFSMVKSIAEFRLQSRVGYRIQDAAYHRTFRLPESFFHTIDSADLAQRIMSIGGIINSYVSSVVITGISTLFSLLYLIRMFQYNSKLTWISLLMLVIYLVIMVVMSFLTLRFQKEEAEKQGTASSKLYQYLNAIAKIRMAGAEDRAIYDYMVPFSGIQSLEIRENRYSTFSSVFSSSSSVIFSMVLYIIVTGILKKTSGSITMGKFMGFNTAFGAFSGAIEQLVQKGLNFYQMKPTVERFMPIFETACEDETDAEFPGELNGGITVNHVSFSYEKGDKLVLDNIYMDIKPGEYVGIVGSSGCGKSTLLKLLLGFEKPLSGRILYDDRDILKLNKYALRQKLGVVLQNGQLIAGSI